jgi:hypothetical protein
MFAADFINKMSSFSTVRFKDPLNTDFGLSGSISPVQNWSQRTWPSSGSRYQNGGMAYEDIIAFANQTGHAIWINVPSLATDDYVCYMARLLRYGEAGPTGATSPGSCSTTAPGNGTETPLNSNITVYVEYSNEPWNAAFPEWSQLYCWANSGKAPSGHSCPVSGVPPSAALQADLASGVLSKYATNGSDPFGRGMLAGMVLTKRVHDIFTTVFGSQASQIKVLYNAQSCCTSNAANYFTILQGQYGAVNTYIPVLAIAPYIYLSNSGDVSSLGTIFSDLNAQLVASGSMQTQMSNALATANKFGMALVGYESGQSLTQSSTNLCAAQVDPRMNTVYTTYYNLWASTVGKGALINHFTFTSACTGNSAWGALTNQADGCSQKWAAIMSLTGGPACTP